ncbi:MAG: hemerythrin domain-containing protein [Cyclobacteriaceae bacterium]
MTVDDIFNIDPTTSKVLEKFHLIQLLGQRVEFEEACERSGICSAIVKRELVSILHTSHPQPEITTWAPDQLAHSLHQVQHAEVKELVKKIETTLDRVVAQYGKSRIELHKIKASFDELREELERHVYTEEAIIFPAIQNIANSRKDQTHKNKLFHLLYPVEVMKAEHEIIFDCMKDIQKASRNFKVPKNTSQSFNTLYQQLQTLKTTLKNILTIENNILYPAALKLEREAGCYE